MMDLIFNDLFDINRTLNKIFNDKNYYRQNYGNYPELNVYENTDEYIAVVKTPGVKKEDIEISFKDNSIKISGERKNIEAEKSNSHLKERFTGKFERNILMSEKIDSDKIAAEFKNGLLIIKMPKSAEIKPKNININ